jgi:hypothetical protein
MDVYVFFIVLVCVDRGLAMGWCLFQKPYKTLSVSDTKFQN